MLIGYVRVSTADGTQAPDLPHDSRTAAGMTPAQIYSHEVSGKRGAPAA